MKKLLIASFLILIYSQSRAQSNLPTEETYKLKNKMQVVFLDYGSLPVTYVCCYINTGTKNEIPGMQSIAGLTSGSLLLGNARYSRVQQDSVSYLLGSGLSASSNDNYSQVTLQFLNKDQDIAMDMFAAALMEPTFPKNEIADRIEEQVTFNTPVKMNITDLADVYSRFFVFGASNPLGRSFYASQIDKITADQVREFYKFNYTPKNCTLVVCGHPDKEKMKALIDHYFSDWQASYGEVNGVSLPDVDIDKKEYAVVNRDNATQAALYWTKKAPNIKSRDLGAFQVANRVFSVMLFKQIREKEGKTYGIGSQFNAADNDGIYTVATQVRNEVVYGTTESFDNVLKQFYDSGAPQEYFTSVMSEIRSGIDGIETPAQVVDLINPLLYPDYAKRKAALAELENMDIEKVNRAIKKYFKPNSYKLLIAGNETALQPQLDKIPGLVKLPLTAIDVDQ